VGINTNNETQMIAFDTNTNTYQTGFVPAVTCGGLISPMNCFLLAPVLVFYSVKSIFFYQVDTFVPKKGHLIPLVQLPWLFKVV
jgi:hypothetical protein